MTAAPNARGLPQYRVVHYVVNPFSGTRVAVAAVVRTPDGNTQSVALPTVPGPECLGSEGAHRHIAIFKPWLARLDRFDSLPEYLGPNFVLGPPQVLPIATSWQQWVTQTIFRREPTVDDASRKSVHHLKTLGRRFFKRYNVDRLVKDNYRLDPRYNLHPITHWVDTGSTKLLMEPLSPHRNNPEKDVSKASTRLTAYRWRLELDRSAGAYTLLAYTLPGLDPALTVQLRESLSDVGSVYDISDPNQEIELINLVQRAGEPRLVNT